MIVFFALLLLLAAPPTQAPAPAATSAAALPREPKEIARSQFIAFASDAVQPSLFSPPPGKGEIAKARALLLSIGRMKRVDQVRRADSRYGLGFVFKFTCEHGSALEKFTLKDGTITSISFSRV